MSPTMILFMICVLVAGVLSSGQTAAVPDAALDEGETPPPLGSV